MPKLRPDHLVRDATTVVRCIAEILNTMLCFVSSFFTHLEILFKSFNWFNSNLINALRPTKPAPKCNFKKQLLAYREQHLPFSKYLQHLSANFQTFRGIVCRNLITRLLEGSDRVSSFWEYTRFFGQVDQGFRMLRIRNRGFQITFDTEMKSVLSITIIYSFFSCISYFTSE